MQSISYRIKSAMFTRGKYRNMLLIVKFLFQLFHLLFLLFFFGISKEFSSCNTRNYNKSTPRTFIEVIRRRKGEFSCLLLKLFPPSLVIISQQIARWQNLIKNDFCVNSWNYSTIQYFLVNIQWMLIIKLKLETHNTLKCHWPLNTCKQFVAP